jgi:hypothetical protein
MRDYVAGAGAVGIAANSFGAVRVFITDISFGALLGYRNAPERFESSRAELLSAPVNMNACSVTVTPSVVSGGRLQTRALMARHVGCSRHFQPAWFQNGNQEHERRPVSVGVRAGVYNMWASPALAGRPPCFTRPGIGVCACSPAQSKEEGPGSQPGSGPPGQPPASAARGSTSFRLHEVLNARVFRRERPSGTSNPRDRNQW